jgi:hypothetical protein
VCLNYSKKLLNTLQREIPNPNKSLRLIASPLLVPAVSSNRALCLLFSCLLSPQIVRFVSSSRAVDFSEIFHCLLKSCASIY